MSEILLILGQGAGGEPPPPPTTGARPNYRIRIGWSGRQEGIFTIGRSAIGGGDVLANELDVLHQFNGPYDTLTDAPFIYPQSFEVARGETAAASGQVQAGEATLDFIDPKGTLNPRSGTSPLSQFLYGMRPVIIDAEIGGYWKKLFTGWTTEFTYDPDIGKKTARIKCHDSFLWLDHGPKPIFVPLPAGSTAQKIGAILDSVQFSKTLRDLETGPNLDVGPEGDGKTKITDLLSAIAKVTLGKIFISIDGEVAFLSRNNAVSRTSRHTFQAIGGIQYGRSLQETRNYATATKEAEVPNPQIVTDPESQAQYGTWEETEFTSPLFANEAAALSWAEYKVNTSKDGSNPIWTVDVVGYSEEATTEILDYDLGERLTVMLPGVAASDFVIQRIVHKGEQGKLHSTKWTLTEVPGYGASPFIIGSSQIGGLDVLV